MAWHLERCLHIGQTSAARGQSRAPHEPGEESQRYQKTKFFGECCWNLQEGEYYKGDNVNRITSNRWELLQRREDLKKTHSELDSDSTGARYVLGARWHILRRTWKDLEWPRLRKRGTFRQHMG